MEHFCTVQQLAVTGPLAQAAVIAGWAGRAREVFRVVEACREITDDRLAGTLVVVDAGDDQPDFAAAVAQYAASAAAGVLVVNRRTAMPQSIVDSADSHRVPLLVCAQNIDRRAVEFAFALAVQLAQNAGVASFAEYCRCWRSPGVSGDLPALLTRLAYYLQNPVVLVDPAFQIMAQGGGETFLAGMDISSLMKAVRLPVLQRKLHDSPLTEAYWQQVALPDRPMLDCYVVPLLGGAGLLGYLAAFAAGGPLNELDLCRVDDAAGGCLAVLDSRKAGEAIEKKYKEHFIYDLLYNNFDSEDALIRRGRLWGWEFSRPQRLLIVEADDFRQLANKNQIIEQLRHAAASLLQQHYRQVIVSELQDQVVIIVPDIDGDDKAARQRLKDVARLLQDEMGELLPKITFSAGIGKFYPSIADICRSYQEAKHALDLGRFIQERGHITHFEELGVIRLLSHVSHDQLDDFYKEHLAGIIDYDEKNDANYLDTLQVYFQQNGDLNLTAEKLFMHPNTLRYRLKKIEELLDADLQKLESRVSLAVACKIAKMRQ